MPWFDNRSVARIINGLNLVLNRLDEIEEVVLRIEAQNTDEQEIIMGLREDLDASLAAIEADVAPLNDVAAGVEALLKKLNEERAAAISSGDIERIKAVDAAIDARVAALAAAVAANTPPTPSGA